MLTIQSAKPFVKWAGGKYRLADTILKVLNKNINIDKYDTYVEPFVGGGGMFFAICEQKRFDNVVLSDINAELINVYIQIQNNLSNLIEELNYIEDEFNSLITNDAKKEFYYELRENYNQTITNEESDVYQASLFIALNKLGFNGLYRVNRKGLFNVPFGQKKNANLYDLENLESASYLLQDVDILVSDFRNSTNYVDERTLVYFDSPYRPLPGSPSFTSYAKSDFNDDDQIALAEVAKKVIDLGGAFFLSNSDPTQVDPDDTFFEDLYADYKIEKISAQRLIGAKSSSRGTVSEIVVLGESEF